MRVCLPGVAIVALAACGEPGREASYEEYCLLEAEVACDDFAVDGFICTEAERMPEGCFTRRWDCLHPPTIGEVRRCIDRQPRDGWDYAAPACERIRACDRDRGP